jgi:hypothetical protein
VALLSVTRDRDGRRYRDFLCPPYDQQLPVGDDIAVPGTMTERVVIGLLQPTVHKLFSRLYRRSEGETIAVDLSTPGIIPLLGLVCVVLTCVIKESFTANLVSPGTRLVRKFASGNVLLVTPGQSRRIVQSLFEKIMLPTAHECTEAFRKVLTVMWPNQGKGECRVQEFDI